MNPPPRARTTVTARWTFEGFHRWPDAPPGRSYLAERHRHLFHGEVTVEVTHTDRQIEFHDLRDVCVLATRQTGGEWGPMSCEAIADVIAVDVAGTWPDQPGELVVAVFEDGECGATVTYRMGEGS